MSPQQIVPFLGSRPLLPSDRRHSFSPSFRSRFLFLFRKKKMGREAAHICDIATDGRFSQAVDTRRGTSRTPPCNRTGGCVCDNCVGNNSRRKCVVLSIGFRRNRIPLGERTMPKAYHRLLCEQCRQPKSNYFKKAT